MYKFYSKILQNTIKNSHLLFSTISYCTRFSTSHEWVKMLNKGNIATIGFSSFSSGFVLFFFSRWLVKIEVDNHEDFENLMTREEYQNFLNNKVGGDIKDSGENIDSGIPGTLILG
ncbi:hypothetical protein DDB_G0287771 [Dictyostelium discoideum AX4]|uniref:Uncharacterized protein n=1 Tax=Dictyostelium discoideum TaxID=44689 RepID=Q54JV9_DICDI|nr:hypothetical protein DDB_G0287771 [Dictyostelium discoideum AX4]EAL63532.1 hypothetical protein DDB_G0287771 [Dictyostelium discoideum AX4]|eukprot:XP_637043.1 hypothetical protein DDB_G0287771 [Dictyostelium discoideum AX4]